MPPAHQFPPAGEYEIYSLPEFFVQNGERGELLVCAGRIRLRTSNPVVDRRGRRRVNLKVLEWEAVGTSELLGGAEIRVRATRSLGSYVVAMSDRADLPGRMVLSILSSTYVNGQQVDEHKGRAEGLISAFPPAKGDLFALSAPAATHDLSALTNGLLPGTLRITASNCKCAN
ncbi:MAG TPA: hypothetical protein VFR37_15260 [Longimicrobium sp.]|nr:hypothetical protein [Longimicrobium sp.]